jgi:hypothetical protein
VSARLFVFALTAMLVPVTLAAQSTDANQASMPRVEIGPYIGVARHSPVGRYLGVIPDRNHLFIGVQLTANIVRTRRWAFAYAPDLVPLLVVSDNPKYRRITRPGGRHFLVTDGRGPVAGVALSPIGFQTQLRAGSRWRPYVAGAAGIVWFTRAVPVAGSRAFNYTFEMGAGARWQYRPREALRLGYKFHHLSNAYTALRNPGLDATVFLVGYERTIDR